MTPARIALPLVLVAVLVAGCGIEDPYEKAEAVPSRTAAAPTPSAAAPATTAAPPATTTPAPAPPAADERPEDVIRRFAKTYMNWTFDELADTRRGLAAQAAGPLRAQLLDDAQRAGAQSARVAGTTTHKGTVEGVLLRRGRPALVVTHETTDFGQGPAQEEVMVYTAELRRVGGTYRLSSFTAEG